MPHLTKSLVEAAKPPPGAQAFFRDDEIRGFALRIIATGAKSFVWEGRVNGRMRRITIGRYPDLTVALARAQALRIRAALADGRDPYQERELKNMRPRFADCAFDISKITVSFTNAHGSAMSVVWPDAKIGTHESFPTYMRTICSNCSSGLLRCMAE